MSDQYHNESAAAPSSPWHNTASGSPQVWHTPSFTKVIVETLGAKAQPDWKERAARLCVPESFDVKITFDSPSYLGLSLDEYDRLQYKLQLVERAARYMAAGMLKGVLKYTGDEVTLEQWMANLIGEGADKMNYDMLTLDAFERGGISRG